MTNGIMLVGQQDESQYLLRKLLGKAEIEFNRLATRLEDARVVVVLGEQAFRSLTGLTGLIERRAPKRGYVYKNVEVALGIEGKYVIGTYEINDILFGGHNLTTVVVDDLRRAVEVSKGGWIGNRDQGELILRPSVYDFKEWAFCCGGDSKGDLIADIETPRSGKMGEEDLEELKELDIKRASFARFDSDMTITVPWMDDYIEVALQVLARAGRVWFWNEKFDKPRLKAKGARLERTCDAMWLRHFVESGIPRGLGYSGSRLTDLDEWKSKSDTNEEFYSAIDSRATRLIVERDLATLRREGRYDAFFRHHTDVVTITDEITQTGILIDEPKRVALGNKFGKEIDSLGAELRSLVPESLCPRKVYSRPPPEAEIGGTHLVGDEEGVWTFDPDGLFVLRFPFNHNSPKQVISYLKWKGYEVPKNYKTDEETSDEKALLKLAKKHKDDKFLTIMLKLREFEKLKGSYVDRLEPSANTGRFHPHFDRSPWTWRFGSDIQQIPKRGDFAKDVRSLLIAPPGSVMASFDYNAAEPLLVGYFAGSESYMRAARYGVHAIVTSQLLGCPISLEWEPDAIRRRVSQIKRDFELEYNACKQGVNGFNYGLKPKGLQMLYPQYFPKQRKAQELYDTYFGGIGRPVLAWQKEMLNQAHFKGHLVTPFGYKYYFHHIFTFKNGEWKPGDEAKAALSAMPQGTLAGVTCEAMLRLKEEGLSSLLRAQVHDEFWFELPDNSSLMGQLGRIKTVMEMELPALGGLVIRVSGKVGRSLGEMTDINFDASLEAR